MPKGVYVRKTPPWNKGLEAPLEERFWPKVFKTETCWVWVAAKDQDGYGHLENWKKRRCDAAHRVSWELHFGPIPEGLMVLHHCDNPPCVRPDHLYLGTAKDNQIDCCMRGRRKMQFSIEDVKYIRSSKKSNYLLSREFSVMPSVIKQVRTKVTYAWV